MALSHPLLNNSAPGDLSVEGTHSTGAVESHLVTQHSTSISAVSKCMLSNQVLDVIRSEEPF